MRSSISSYNGNLKPIIEWCPPSEKEGVTDDMFFISIEQGHNEITIYFHDVQELVGFMIDLQKSYEDVMWDYESDK